MTDTLKGLGGLSSGAALGQAGFSATASAASKAVTLAGAGQQTGRAAQAGEPNARRQAEIDKAATGFESLLLKQMFGAMWAGIPKDGILSGSREEEMYRDMLNDAMAEATAKGQGLGIKEIVRRELMRHEK